MTQTPEQASKPINSGVDGQEDIISRPLSAEADSFARKIVDEFAASLLHQAKLLASRRKDELVLRSHIQEALNSIKKSREQSWWAELLLLLGGILLGTFVQGFITELSNQMLRPIWVVVYVTLGFIGLIMVFWAFFQKYNSN